MSYIKSIIGLCIAIGGVDVFTKVFNANKSVAASIYFTVSSIMVVGGMH
ncbi:hypothetical protein UFOVP855_31 [uncultured Caudovirales phage]|uniref:Uncharacterized protein n=2 Tax=uncultured Caudovirales phage TaxID=2100421 RepID=A0A6J5MRL6_9CAUD|nr:hypothetical protein UFOVP527_8 [uncultured Caudovirales phage]CAB4167595.1 hypothetical protein UFOVP855_31 [uncultured Caudovirales phage]CAB4173602.1 hypothetical protein UFOVP954_43 [uncultured Caudovirales phage]CAB4178972.1 hypothetical protein UFOVP1026_18 [uncultured Caudovirales phage]CAB4188232.1 hypothetical protein UFOVP1180_2 [uncultured Caudovirales phage]